MIKIKMFLIEIADPRHVRKKKNKKDVVHNFVQTLYTYHFNAVLPLLSKLKKIVADL